MELNAKIDIRVEANDRSGYFIEYKIGNGKWKRRSETPLFTYAGAAASAMQLRERVKGGLTRSVKVVLGIEDEEE